MSGYDPPFGPAGALHVGGSVPDPGADGSIDLVLHSDGTWRTGPSGPVGPAGAAGAVGPGGAAGTPGALGPTGAAGAVGAAGAEIGRAHV